ncbi:MAG: contractile injection system protein, VgrG/Pvc8 family [Candidatus Binataceae bacterium]
MATAITSIVRTPQWVLMFLGVNITADISRMVTEVTYTDHIGGQSSEIEIKVEDRDRRWQGPWYPQLGDLVNLQIGYEGESTLPCGDFELDELELDGPPDSFTMRGLAAFITEAQRTPNSAGYESRTLLAIATQIAAKYGMTVVDQTDHLNLTFERVSQNQETDLAFLHRLAQLHNYEFNIRGTQMVFYSRVALEGQSPVATIGRRISGVGTGVSPVANFSFKSKTAQVYKAATVSWLDPNTKKEISTTIQADAPVATGDTYKIPERAENQQMALLKAIGALSDFNRLQATANITLPGTRNLVAGNVVALSGFGNFDGNYLIETARHALKRASGYTTEIEVRTV